MHNSPKGVKGRRNKKSHGVREKNHQTDFRFFHILPTQQDKRYLTPYVQEVANEESERAAWDTVSVKKGH